MESLTNKVAKVIKVLRIGRNYTQEHIADVLGISTSGYAKLERGETDLTISRVEQIAKFYEISSLELLQMAETNAITIHTNCQHTGNVGNHGVINLYGSEKKFKKEPEIIEIKDLLTTLLQELSSLKDVMKKNTVS